jgi:hypothetical protein
MLPWVWAEAVLDKSGHSTILNKTIAAQELNLH